MSSSSVRPKPKTSAPRPSGAWKSHFKKTIFLVLAISLAIHLLFLLSFGSVALFKGSIPKLPFVSERIPEEVVQQEVAGPDMEESSEPPEPAAELPPAEEVSMAEPSSIEEAILLPTPAMTPISVVATPTPVVAKTGGGGGGASQTVPSTPSSGRGMGKAPVFFGIEMEKSQAKVLVVLDTSNSMFERKKDGKRYFFDYGVIKKETAQLLENLAEGCEFNVVIYEGGSLAFDSKSQPATAAAKARAAAWIMGLDENPDVTIRRRPGLPAQKLLEGGGTRLDTALKQAFSFQPSVVFILTDGEINRIEEGKKGSEDISSREMITLIDELQRGLPEPATLHIIQYLTKTAKADETNTLKAIAQRGKGKFRTVEAKTLRVEKEDAK